jgi:predicted transcriptional regulator
MRAGDRGGIALNHVEREVLTFVVNNPRCGRTAVATAVGIPASQVSTVVARLRHAGMLEMAGMVHLANPTSASLDPDIELVLRALADGPASTAHISSATSLSLRKIAEALHALRRCGLVARAGYVATCSSHFPDGNPSLAAS